MEESIFDIRLDIIVNEYLRSIYRYKDKYPYFLEYPYLNIEEFNNAYRTKKVGVRSHLRMLSIAVLTEYISVNLNYELSQKISSPLFQDSPFFEKAINNDPLAFLLIRLHNNREEINSGNNDNSNHFENLMLLDREFRIASKFKDLLYLLDQTNVDSVEIFIKDLYSNKTRPEFWGKTFSGTGQEKIAFSNKILFEQINELIDFLLELGDFIGAIKSSLISSAVWHYFRSFLSAVRLILPQLEVFLITVKGFDIFSRGAIETDFSEGEKAEIRSAFDSNITASISNIKSLTEPYLHSTLTQFLRSSFGREEVLVAAGDYQEFAERIDMEGLRRYIKPKE